MRKLKQDSVVIYIKMILSFLIFTVLGVGIFFYCVQMDVKQNTETAINQNLEKQGVHFRSILDIQYKHLESMASYLGQSEELLSEENMRLIEALYQSDIFDRVSIILPDGTSNYDNGTVKDVSGRRYFQEAISGNWTLSDPLQSKTDGEIRVVLGVPIYDDQEEIVGVLGGSYDVKALNHTLFKDFYDGAGYSMLVMKDGNVVFGDTSNEEEGLHYGDNLFTYCEGLHYRAGASLEDIQEGFEAQEGGYVELEEKGQKKYLAYTPLGINDWMICYVVPVSNAQSQYRFINRYEVVLSVYIAFLALALFLWIVYVNDQKQKDIMRLASTDAMTGVRNKKNTEETINQWLKSEGACGNQAFLMMDIDYFKQINDNYGHAVGDEVLMKLGRLLKEQFCGDDIAGRIGGDEFVVLMRNVTDPSEAAARAEALAQRIREIQVDEMKGQTVTSSMGISFSPQNGSTFEELYKCADKALYKTKERGRNGCTVYGE